MENFFDEDHPFQSAVQKAKKEQGELIAKDPKHGGLLCEELNEWLSDVESKIKFIFLLYQP